MRLPLLIGSFLALAAAEPFLTLHTGSERVKKCPLGVKSCIEAEVNFQELKNTDELELPNAFKLKRLSYEEKDNYFVATYGYENPHGVNGYLLFAKDFSWATGSILDDVNSKKFTLAPCTHGQECHIWSEVEPPTDTRVSAIPFSAESRASNIDIEALKEQGKKDKTTVAKVSVTMLVTPEAKAALGNKLAPFCFAAVEGVSFALLNSRVPIDVWLRCIENTNVGIADFNNDINELWKNFAEDKAASKSSDFTFVLTSGTWEDMSLHADTIEKGISLGVYNVNFGVNDGLAFSIMMAYMAGARANEEVETNKRFPYGHAFLIRPPENSGYKTLLAEGLDLNYTKIISYFSNPEVTYKGMKIGTEQTNNNARVLREQRFLMAAMGDESISCTNPLPPVPPTKCKLYFMRDGYCDDVNNNAGCGFDGGDCCTTRNPNPNMLAYCVDCKERCITA